MNRILIIHPEGNISNNPNLHGIVELLCENGFTVDVCSNFREDIYQHSPVVKANLYLENEHDPRKLTEIILKKYLTRYCLVVGVDLGIIEASRISRIRNLPLGYISYEIFFEDEAGSDFKQKEIDACRNVTFVIVQDAIRANKLSEENHIGLTKMILVPVGGRKPKAYQKNWTLYEALGIPREKNIALVMGSTDRWTMTPELIATIPMWGDNWVLVIHNRYGIGAVSQEVKQIASHYPDKVYIASSPFEDLGDMSSMIHSADVGIALYNPTNDSIYHGKNIQFIGLSSGKVATYLQHGLPVIACGMNLLSEYVTRYHAGSVVENPDKVHEFLPRGGRSQNENCENLFREVFDLDLYGARIVESVENAIKVTMRTDIPYSVQEISDEIYTRVVKPHEWKAQIYCLNKEQVLNSSNYRIGRCLLAPIRYLRQVIRRIKHWKKVVRMVGFGS